MIRDFFKNDKEWIKVWQNAKGDIYKTFQIDTVIILPVVSLGV